MGMQVILGAGGTISKELVPHLRPYVDRLRLVSRSPRAYAPDDDVFPCDIANEKCCLEAVKKAEVVYLTVGLPYQLQVWQTQWPKIMTNVIKACTQEGAKLVFFDNVYMYGLVDGPMTEETPYNPCSRKGEVRALIARQLQEAMAKGEVTALIARSADFYGPHTANTFVYPMVFQALKAGKKPNWLGRATVPHSFTFTPDAGKAVALLGNTPSAYNQVWHLPTDAVPLTGKEFIAQVAEALHQKSGFTTISKFMLRMAGLFNPLAKESLEMIYQYDHPYRFDSSRFAKAFFPATPYREGIKKTISSL